MTLNDLSVAEARTHVLADAEPLGTESVPIARSLGRTLARDVVSSDDAPPFDTSSMDGFAVRAADLPDAPAELPVIETIAAGQTPRLFVLPGTCARIFTGAPLPEGADAIVPVEWTEAVESEGDRVRLSRSPERGQFIRRRGSALAEGETVLAAGSRVTPPALGMMAAAGNAQVTVTRQPRVAIIVTGDEVVRAGASLRDGQIPDVNGPGLSAQVTAAGGTPLGPFHAGDTPNGLASALDAASSADLVVVAGGVSMGDRDLVRPEMARRGVTWRFWRVMQRPGKPLAYGVLVGLERSTPILGLPGNPISAAVCFEVYARPLMARLLGRTDPDQIELGLLAEDVPKAEGLTTFVRVNANRDKSGQLRLTLAGAQDSHVYRSLVQADGLAILPAEWTSAPAGRAVDFVRFDWGR